MSKASYTTYLIRIASKLTHMGNLALVSEDYGLAMLFARESLWADKEWRRRVCYLK